MNCPRCEEKTQIVSEYFNYNEESLVRDNMCTTCASVVIEHFYKNGNYKSDWIDLNV